MCTLYNLCTFKKLILKWLKSVIKRNYLILSNWFKKSQAEFFWATRRLREDFNLSLYGSSVSLKTLKPCHIVFRYHSFVEPAVRYTQWADPRTAPIWTHKLLDFLQLLYHWKYPKLIKLSHSELLRETMHSLAIWAFY